MQKVDEVPTTAGPQVQAYASAPEAIAAFLAPHEQVSFFDNCLRRTTRDRFETCTVAATSERLLVAGPLIPWGFELKEAHLLTDCSLVNGKERSDGSRLLILHHDTGNLCLYFNPQHASEADDLLAAIDFLHPQSPIELAAAGPPTPPVPTPTPAAALLAEPLSEEPMGTNVFRIPDTDVDTFALTQFLHDLTQDDIDNEGNLGDL